MEEKPSCKYCVYKERPIDDSHCAGCHRLGVIGFPNYKRNPAVFIIPKFHLE